MRAQSAAMICLIFFGGIIAGGCGDSAPSPPAETTPDTLESDGRPTEEVTAPLPAPVPSDCRPNLAPFPERTPPTTPATLPWLRVEGTDLVDEDGDRVMLRGHNFGSWLKMETWIAGIGVLSEAELIEMVPVKAAEFGIADLITQARYVNILEWTFYTRPRWVMVQEWREHSLENAAPEQREAVEAFWEWFDSEPWIFEERSLWRWLEQRFGYERMWELRRAFLDNYITELDFERAAGLGMNLVRVPFWYQALETDIEGENHFVEDGWRRLDQVVEWARQHGLYVMLDMHGAPGGQSPWWHQGLENGGFFWETQECIDKTARLWRAVADYFKDEPHIAIFDLLNEPAGAPDAETYGAVQDQIYRAIREVNENHIIMLGDGFKKLENLMSPKELGWENAMMSIHDYPGGNTPEAHKSAMNKKIEDVGEQWERYEVPLFYGEFNVYNPTDFMATDDPENRWEVEAMGLVLDLMNRRGIHWAPWTWKYFDHPSLWGVYHPADNPGHRIDVKDATFDEIRAEFEALHSRNFEIDQLYEEALMSHTGAPGAPLNLGPLAELPGPAPEEAH